MSTKCIIALILFATIAALFACSNNSSDDSIKSLRIDAENAFRRGDYKKAYEICSRIVKEDSSISFGYHGMAKASFGEWGINIADILTYIETKENDEGETEYQFAFLDSSVKFQNNIFQATKKVSEALAPIDRRDSLTSHYEFHKRGLKGFDSLFTIKVKNPDGTETTKKVPLAERFKDFRNTFCNTSGDCSDTNITRTPFPLTDREYPGDYFSTFLFVSHMMKSLLDFYDSDHNECIAKRGIKGIDYPEDSEWANWGCKLPHNSFDLAYGFRIENGKLIIDMENITEDDAEAINDKIDGFSGDINEVVDIMDAIGMNSGSGDLKGDVEKFKGYSAFYKIGTGIDEDGDGCIEEDILDGQDNDGDGLKNGNARIVFGKINHSMFGDDPESLENINNPLNDTITLKAPVYIPNHKDADCKVNKNLCTELPGDETGYATVIKFTQEPSYWTSNDMVMKLKIAQDTVCPPRYSLDYRKENVGGCWPNYDEKKFVKYWLQGRGNRTHLSCKDYEGAE